MKELLLKDYEQLVEFYSAGSISHMRALYHKLLKIKRNLLLGRIKLNGVNETVVDDENAFVSWVGSNFPDMEQYLWEKDIPKVFDEIEFPRFQKTDIMPSDVNINILKRIRNIEIWGTEHKIKQTCEKIESVVFDIDLLTFYLSNNAFLQIFDPQQLQDSQYCLTINGASKIVLVYPKKEIRQFATINEKVVEVFSNKVLLHLLDVSSVFINAIEIIK
ncbi:hypothetical protein [Mucilaginibacter sp.]|uniref:hypothetical protein n=1 Tax=Mucilaginibacter sp. TaxID=1882438 RepID=UPI00262A8033|nr:hypothetical protein [Mucilaginibacter sp.]MDB5130219.1 hypothetical protein [Mucilaginibacter sp.]